MALPDSLERLKDISIDTLGLSESTSALLKWYSMTHVLDCMAVFCDMAQLSDDRWPRHVMVLFDEVRPKLIAAGYWDLVMDAEMCQVLIKHVYNLKASRLIQLADREIDLYRIRLEALGLSDPRYQFKSVGECIDSMLIYLRADSKLWRELGTYRDSSKTADEPRNLYEYMFWVLQPRLVELGWWKFVEEHYDDFEVEEMAEMRQINWSRMNWDGGNREEDEDDWHDDDWDGFEGPDDERSVFEVLRQWLAGVMRWIVQTITRH